LAAEQAVKAQPVSTTAMMREPHGFTVPPEPALPFSKKISECRDVV